MRNVIKYIINIRAARDAIRNPRQAGFEYVKGIAEGYVFLWGIWIALVLGVLGLLGFSGLLGGPYVIAQVLFYVVLFVIILVSLFIYLMTKLVVNKVNKFVDTTTSKFKSYYNEKAGPKIRNARVIDIEELDPSNQNDTSKSNGARSGRLVIKYALAISVAMLVILSFTLSFIF